MLPIKRFIVGVFLILSTIVHICSAQSLATSDALCIGEISCAGCVEAGPGCAWCKQWDYTGPRCDHPDVLRIVGCPEKDIYWRGSSEIKLGRNDPFSDFSHDEEHRGAVQVRPQNALIRLRAGETSVNFTLTFRAAKNYPLDVYYLMDLTWSMQDDKETLANLGIISHDYLGDNQVYRPGVFLDAEFEFCNFTVGEFYPTVKDLATALSNLTENFRLGFGSYVDKPAMPFVDEARLHNPCSAERQTCAAAYGFKHQLRLDRDTSQFASHIREAPVSGNVDNAEGGLDAIMQSIVCKEAVGWANDSRKILLLASDGILHFAGDGKLAGAIRNNDGQCHLDLETGMYTESTVQDYPSLGQIDTRLLNDKVNLIFAVTQDRLAHYTQVANVFETQTIVAVLEEDSSNIIQLVRQGYQEIVSSVAFHDNGSSPLRLRYHTTCGGRQQMRETNGCDGVQQAEEYEFLIELYLDSCPTKEKHWQQRVQIEERGLTSGVSLNVELLCGCDCEFERNSQLCTSHGDFECGVCHCHEGWFGKACECTGRNATTLPELDVSCLPGDAALHGIDVCWGRGDCVCGRCECHAGVHGRFCECDDSRCDWGANGERCGGPSRGRCECGKCRCIPGWGGSSCSCPTSDETCIAPGDNKPCSGQGRCVCGECVCDATDHARFTGHFCEKCDTCQGLCELYRDCVTCNVFKHNCPASGVDPCRNNNSDSTLTIVNDLHVPEDSSEELCVYNDPADDCQFKFSYKLDTRHRQISLKVLENKTCYAPLDTASVAIGIMVVVVVIGLLFLIIWRVFVTAKDKRDYERFVEESKRINLDAGMNPLYKPATTYYSVPHAFTEPVMEPLTPPPSATTSL